MNDNQFRCTLTKDDLAEHHISIRDISYGSDQTRALLREMMEQAGEQFGFDAEDMPLMIEAVPLNGESIVFVITKVEDPEELDTRFAKFAPGLRGAGDGDAEDEDGGEYENVPAKPALKADEMISLFRQRVSRLQNAENPESLSRELPGLNLSRVYAFSGLRLLSQAAKDLAPVFKGGTSLYKSPDGRKYLLRVTKETTPIDQFNRFCNLLSEYGTPLELGPAGEAYLGEHCRRLIGKKALERLAEVFRDAAEEA